jgi:hypothetical protein
METVSRLPNAYTFKYNTLDKTLQNRITGKLLKSYKSISTNKHTGEKYETGEVYWKYKGLMYFEGYFNNEEYTS